MRRLISDEVQSLNRFLVEDNEEAIGIEIHIGKDWRSGYSQPDTIQQFTLEELAGRELIQIGDVVLCALVGDQLYCIEKGRYVDSVHSTCTEYAYRGVNRVTSDYLYIRAMVTYGNPIATLPEEEVLTLEKFLVKENHRVEGVSIVPGSMGIGGSNTSGFSADAGEGQRYTAEELSGKEPIRVGNYELCALVGDVLYFRYKDQEGKMRTFTLNHRKKSYHVRGDGIAYDTVFATKVSLLLKQD